MAKPTHNYFFQMPEAPWRKKNKNGWRTKLSEIIAVDVDDVCGDFVQGVIERHGPPVIWSNGLEAMWPNVDFKAMIHEKKFHADMKPIKGTPEAILELQKRGYTILYLTARPATLDKLTVKWLRDNGFPDSSVVCLGSEVKKIMLSTIKFGAVIDDKTDNLYRAKRTGSKPICFAQKWNEAYTGKRYGSWEEILHDFK